MLKRLPASVKLAFLVLVLAVVGWKLYGACRSIGFDHIRAVLRTDWSWAVLSLLCSGCVVLCSAASWVWLLRRIEKTGSLPRLAGAYCFSQIGKYVPGKIMLLLMRIERTGRLGISNRATATSTIIENAAYLISGAAAGSSILLYFWIREQPADYLWIILGSLILIVLLLLAFHPAVFYSVADALLRKLGRAEIAMDKRLSVHSLLASILMMAPCWFFGGLGLWATARCIIPVGIEHYWTLVSAFALSVVIGCVSFLPGGLGVREVVQGVVLLPVIADTLAATPGSSAEAKIIATLIVMLQRVFQITAEAGLAIGGGWITSLSSNSKEMMQQPVSD
ncbi:MAG: hypothetical protein GXX84_15235 [Acidobacteria bacterium]|nr:hypothetical protein [Acidobacteriota bacterium]